MFNALTASIEELEIQIKMEEETLKILHEILRLKKKLEGREEPIPIEEAIPIEEDSDEIFTPMPTKCINYKCENGEVKENDKGFMCCTICGSSYGKAYKNK